MPPAGKSSRRSRSRELRGSGGRREKKRDRSSDRKPPPRLDTTSKAGAAKRPQQITEPAADDRGEDRPRGRAVEVRAEDRPRGRSRQKAGRRKTHVNRHGQRVVKQQPRTPTPESYSVYESECEVGVTRTKTNGRTKTVQHIRQERNSRRVRTPFRSNTNRLTRTRSLYVGTPLAI